MDRDFESRRVAGRALARELRAYADSDAVVVGVTRGGMVVAHEVARALHLPLDALVVHNIAEPGQRHAHLGVVVEPEHLVVNRRRLRTLDLSPEWLESAVGQGVREVRRRGAAVRGRQERTDLAHRPVIVVDDSAGSGATLRAAVRAVRALGARDIVVAVPVAPACAVATLRRLVDRVVCLATPGQLIAGNMYYPMPGEATDEDICRLLAQHHPTPLVRHSRS